MQRWENYQFEYDHCAFFFKCNPECLVHMEKCIWIRWFIIYGMQNNGTECALLQTKSEHVEFSCADLLLELLWQARFTEYRSSSPWKQPDVWFFNYIPVLWSHDTNLQTRPSAMMACIMHYFVKSCISARDFSPFLDKVTLYLMSFKCMQFFHSECIEDDWGR